MRVDRRAACGSMQCMWINAMRVDQHSSCGSTTCVWMNATCVWINPGRGERDKKGVRVEKYICLECNNVCRAS